MAARTLDELRRILARIGTDTAARRVDAAIPAAVRHPAEPAVAVSTVPPVGRYATTHAAAVPSVRTSGGAARMAVRPARTAAVGGGWTAAVHDAPTPDLRPARVAPITTATVAARTAAGATPPTATVRAAESRAGGRIGTETTGTAAVRCMRRTPVAWQHISPDRLRAAWQAILVEHGHPGADLELVGVYGPLPVDAVMSVALAADRRAVIGLSGDARRGGAGDLALARHKPTGRLLRSAGAAVRR